MIEQPYKLLIFQKDFTGQGEDNFYWFEDNQIVDTDAENAVRYSGAIICHDFWLIRDVLFDKTGTLPKTIVDLDELRISISGDPDDRPARENYDITTELKRYGATNEVCSSYKNMFNKAIPFDRELAQKAAVAMVRMYAALREKALEAEELERFVNVEVPIFQVLQKAMSAGIAINTKGLTEMRAQAEYEYFRLLKEYSAKHNMPLEAPNPAEIKAKLLAEGFNLDDVSVRYLLEFMPHKADFGGDTIRLQSLDAAKRVLGSLSLKSSSTRPIIDVFGSRTSRIHIRSPNLQNIPKKYRSIIAPHKGKQLCYVDYDQYEVGIMAALSKDPELTKLYAEGDMYQLFATQYLGLSNNRKAAKQLFLSYAYGMSRKALIDAAVSLGVERQKAKTAFNCFVQYETWKKTIWDTFLRENRVSTLLGNHFKRIRSGPLSGKEERSTISQVVQGTAALVFKRTLLEVSKLDDVTIILPMHDALLFEHEQPATPELVVTIFESIMTKELACQVKGKASIGEFVGA